MFTIKFKCSDCGEPLIAAATDISGAGVPTVSINPHECFPEIGEERTESISDWSRPEPVKEMTEAGKEGLILNRCMLCGEEAGKTGTNRHDGHDSFTCSCEFCKAEFEETGIAPELVPCGFGEDFEYNTMLDNGELLEFIVLFPGYAESVMVIKSNKGGATVHVTKDGDSEFFVAPEGLGGQGEKVYPYCGK